MIGSVRSVDTVRLGTSLVNDVSEDDTILVVRDVFDFDEDGGTLLLDVGEEIEANNPILNYISIEESSSYTDEGVVMSVIVLDPLTPVPVDIIDVGIENPVPVHIYPIGEETQAVVYIERDEGTDAGEDTDDDPESTLFTARLSHSVAALLPDGFRTDETGYENVTIIQDGDDWVITDVLGTPATIDGSYIDPDSTIPPEALTDGEPPEFAPVVVASPFALRAVQADWEPILNDDPVTYTVYASQTSPISMVQENVVEVTSGTHAVFSKINGVDISTESPTYVCVVPSDGDGDGPVSNTATTTARKLGATDIDAGAITPPSLSPDALVKNLTYNGSVEYVDAVSGFADGWVVQTQSWSSCTLSNLHAAFGTNSIRLNPSGSLAWSNIVVNQHQSKRVKVDRSSNQAIVAGLSFRSENTYLGESLTMRLNWFDASGSALTNVVDIVEYSVASNRLYLYTNVDHGLVYGDSITVSGISGALDGTYSVNVNGSDHKSIWVAKTHANQSLTPVSATYTTPLSSVVPNIYRLAATDVWTRVSGRVNIPDGASSYGVSIRFGGISSGSGSLFVDNITTDFVISAAYIEANSISTNEISSDYVYAGRLEANQIHGESIFGNFAQIDKIVTGPNNPKVVIDSQGIVATNAQGGTKFNLPTNTDLPAKFSGDAVLDSATIVNKLTISGKTNEIQRGADLKLGYALSKPNSPADLVYSFPSVDIVKDINAAELGYKRLSDGYWYAVYPFFGTYEVVRYTQSPDGSLTDRESVFVSNLDSRVSTTFYPSDILEYNNNIYILGNDTATESTGYYTRYQSVHVVTMPTTPSVPVSEYLGRFRVDVKDYSEYRGAITRIGSTGYICRHRAVNGGDWVLSQFTLPTSFSNQLIIPTRDALGNNTFKVADHCTSIQPVSSGNFLGDSSTGTRWAVVRQNETIVYSFDRAGTLLQQTNEQYAVPTSKTYHGAFWTGTQWAIWDNNTIYWLPNGNSWSGAYNSTRKWWACYSWFDSNTVGGQHESDVSDPTPLSVLKFSTVGLSTPTAPEDVGSSDKVTGVRMYINSNSTLPPALSTYYRKSVDLPDGVYVDYFNTQPSGGGIPRAIDPISPTPPPFPASTPARIYSESGGLVLSGDGDADIPGLEARASLFSTFSTYAITSTNTWLGVTGFVDSFTHDYEDVVYTGSGVYDINRSGWYNLSLYSSWQSVGSNVDRRISIFSGTTPGSGSEILRCAQTSTGTVTLNGSMLYYLTSGSSITVGAFSSTTTNISMVRFGVHRLGK